MSRAYSADLAYIHHEGFSNFIRQSTPHLLKLLSRPAINKSQDAARKQLVVDLGCGSGVWARELVRAGYDVLGIDVSDSMIRLARKNAPGARFVKGSFLKFQLPPCHAVTALGEVINYLFDPGGDAPQLGRFFARVHAALRPGGVFIVDVASPGRGGPTGRREGFSLGRDWAIVFRAEEDRRKLKLRRTITSFRRVGKLYRRTNEIHEQKLYAAGKITGQLREAGFRVQRLPGYGSSRFPEGLASFLATKRTGV
jgi:SAM-dependent methyltransferase